MEEKLHRYIFNAAFKVDHSNNFEIKEILNYANCGQVFEGGLFLVGSFVWVGFVWFGLGFVWLVGWFFREKRRGGGCSYLLHFMLEDPKQR